MTKDEAKEAIKEAYGNSEYTYEIIKALEQEPRVDFKELKRKIFMEVDGGTDDKWLSYADVCDNISNSIDEFKAELPSVTPIKPKGHWREVDTNMYACSKCSHVLTIDPLDNSILGMNTCPFCSTEMEGVVDDKRRVKRLR